LDLAGFVSGISRLARFVDAAQKGPAKPKVEKRSGDGRQEQGENKRVKS